MMDAEKEPQWTCIACLELCPRSVWNENDGICAACAEGEWPRIMNQLPPSG